MELDNRANLYSPEAPVRAVRMVLDNQVSYANQAATINALLPKIGCGWDTLRRWIYREEADAGHQDGMTSDERARIKESKCKVG